MVVTTVTARESQIWIKSKLLQTLSLIKDVKKMDGQMYDHNNWRDLDQKVRNVSWHAEIDKVKRCGRRPGKSINMDDDGFTS